MKEKDNGLIIRKYALEYLKDLTQTILLSDLFNIIKDKRVILDNKFYKNTADRLGLAKNTVKSKIQDLIGFRVLSTMYIDNKEHVYIDTNIYNKLTKDKGIFRISSDILQNKHLSLSDKGVLSYILSYTKQYGQCLSFSKTIANDLHISDIQVRKSISKLKRYKLIDCELEKKKGFIKKRTMKTNIENVKEFNNNYMEYMSVNNIEQASIKKSDVETIENAKIDNADVESANVENIENAKITKIEQANIFVLNGLSDIDLSKCSDSELNKLYFSLKNQMELVKSFRNNLSK